MLSRVRTCALYGVEANAIDVEVEVRPGKTNFCIIGLADSAVRESRDRVQSALRHSGFQFGDQVLVNLAPAELKKEGSGFDLAVAMGILAASEQIRVLLPRACSFHGELALDGTLKPVRGMLALAIEARSRGVQQLFVPADNAEEAALVSGVQVFPAKSLRDVVGHMRNQPLQAWSSAPSAPEAQNEPMVNEVWGQKLAKRALLIAAAGQHNLLLIGPPGCGKSMLAERLPSLLSPLSEHEKLEVIKIHSTQGASIRSALQGVRPFRAPHHTVSDAGLIGGGVPPRAGEITLAHQGVLFLDEFPEFRRSALEALRAPLETGHVRISRAKSSILLPAQFQLIAAMNPCPCGRLGDASQSCLCSRAAVFAYLRKLSQPILDRIDMHVEMERVSLTDMKTLDSKTVRSREQELREEVLKAQARQLRRQGMSNAALKGRALLENIHIAEPARTFLETFCERKRLSARSYSRILRVAQTIADLGAVDIVLQAHVAEALQLRSLEQLQSYCAAA